MIAETGYWSTSVNLGWAVGTEDVKNVVNSSREIYHLFTADLVEGVYICLVYGNWIIVSSNGACLHVYIREVSISTKPDDMVLESCIQVSHCFA